MTPEKHKLRISKGFQELDSKNEIHLSRALEILQSGKICNPRGYYSLGLNLNKIFTDKLPDCECKNFLYPRKSKTRTEFKKTKKKQKTKYCLQNGVTRRTIKRFSNQD